MTEAMAAWTEGFSTGDVDSSMVVGTLGVVETLVASAGGAESTDFFFLLAFLFFFDRGGMLNKLGKRESERKRKKESERRATKEK